VFLVSSWSYTTFKLSVDAAAARTWALEKEIDYSEVYGWKLAEILLIDILSHSGYQSNYYNFHGISDVQPLYSLNPSFCNLQPPSQVALVLQELSFWGWPWQWSSTDTCNL
jgi:hypothetical protein